MNQNPLKKLALLGQSIWLDYIRRDLITGGGLRRLIEEDGLAGMTSNPTLFEKAIGECSDYDDEIRSMANQGKNETELYEAISLHDVQMAADEFRRIYDETGGKSGFVSLEVNPHLAHDTPGTVDEARRLWTGLNRPNVFIKVPATLEGLPAITRLTAEGINVNVTLLFGLQRYRQVAQAFIEGLDSRIKEGKPVENVTSVASFFLSRIDTLVDPMLEALARQPGENGKIAGNLYGQVAVASAKLAYRMYREIFSGEEFAPLAAKGARSQRLLWASTGAKNPKFSDIKYIEPLIGADTVNSVPLETLNAYRDHGDPKRRIELDVDGSRRILEQLQLLRVNLDGATQRLEDEGVDKFSKAYDTLLSKLHARF
jgi:transaldolase